MSGSVIRPTPAGEAEPQANEPRVDSPGFDSTSPVQRLLAALLGEGVPGAEADEGIEVGGDPGGRGGGRFGAVCGEGEGGGRQEEDEPDRGPVARG